MASACGHLHRHAAPRGFNSSAVYRDVRSPRPEHSVGQRRARRWARHRRQRQLHQRGLARIPPPPALVTDTETWSNGYFLQDSWTIANVLTLELRRPARHADHEDHAPPGESPDAPDARPQGPVGAARPGHLGLHRHRPRQDPGRTGACTTRPSPSTSRCAPSASKPSLHGRYQVGTCRNNRSRRTMSRASTRSRTARTSSATRIGRAPARTSPTLTGTAGDGLHASPGGGFSAGRSRPQGLLHPAVRRRHPVRGAPGPHRRRRLHRPSPWQRHRGHVVRRRRQLHHRQPHGVEALDVTSSRSPARPINPSYGVGTDDTPAPLLRPRRQADARLRRRLGHPEQALLQEVAGAGQLHLVVDAAATTPASSAGRTSSSTRTSPPSTTSSSLLGNKSGPLRRQPHAPDQGRRLLHR